MSVSCSGNTASYVIFFSNAEGSDKVPAEIPKSNDSLNENKLGNLNDFYAYAQRIVNKICDLEVLACEQNPDIIAVTESCINADIPDESVSLEGYTLLRKDRLDTKMVEVEALYSTHRLKKRCTLWGGL